MFFNRKFKKKNQFSFKLEYRKLFGWFKKCVRSIIESLEVKGVICFYFESKVGIFFYESFVKLFFLNIFSDIYFLVMDIILFVVGFNWCGMFFFLEQYLILNFIKIINLVDRNIQKYKNLEILRYIYKLDLIMFYIIFKFLRNNLF